MTDLTVTLIQAGLHWEDPKANLAAFDRHLARIEGPTDLILLPETFSTGFSMDTERLAETMDGPTVAWLLETAARKGADIAGSLIIREGGRYFNRLLWARPDGGLLAYDKRHLLEIYGETDAYTPGTERLTVTLKGWRIRPFICFDLRFPAWTRNHENGYDLALYLANWPDRRASHWRLLLPARAVENQSWVIGLNRVGVDGSGYRYAGDSMIVDPVGNILFRADAEETIHTGTLSREPLVRFRSEFPAMGHADRIQIDPQPP